MSLDDRMKKTKLPCAILIVMYPLLCFGHSRMDGRTLQAQLDEGKDIALQPGQVVELRESLKFRRAGQRTETVGARTALQYARIVHAQGSQGTVIEAKGISGASLTKLVLDGNRPGFQHAQGILTAKPMLSFGGKGGIGQEVRNCIVISSRSAGGWAAIHVHEGGRGIVIKDNIVFSSGTDIRGNGRSLAEKPFGWGDGISTASRDTMIVNNLIYDATDEGIMVQGAPGTQVKGNVIVALSREMLGGIALIDPFNYYECDEKKRSLVEVIRSDRSPKDSKDALGYRDAPYPKKESMAVVSMAFIEILGRDPQEQESHHWNRWLRKTRSTADSLRRRLITMPEFVWLHGYVDPLDLHTWRNDRWLKMILETCSGYQAQGKDWPNAREWNEQLLKTLRRM